MNRCSAKSSHGICNTAGGKQKYPGAGEGMENEIAKLIAKASMSRTGSYQNKQSTNNCMRTNKPKLDDTVSNRVKSCEVSSNPTQFDVRTRVRPAYVSHSSREQTEAKPR